MKVSLFQLFFLTFSVFSFGQDLNSDIKTEKTFVLSMAKGGTHLLGKLLQNLLPHGSIHSIPWTELHNLSNIHSKVLVAHLASPYNYLSSDPFFHTFFSNGIILIRDPRDVVISAVHWIASGKAQSSSWWTPLSKEKFSSLSFKDQITEIIKSKNDRTGISASIESALLWSKNPSVYVCRFEDLVGPKGGGSKEKQQRAILAIAQQLGIPLSDQQAIIIGESLFGDTHTFREGSIGSWKKDFTHYHKTLFKDLMGQGLLDLGYELDNDW